MFVRFLVFSYVHSVLQHACMCVTLNTAMNSIFMTVIKDLFSNVDDDDKVVD